MVLYVLNVTQTVTEECASKIYGNKVPFNESLKVYRLSPMLLHVMIKSRVKLKSANIWTNNKQWRKCLFPKEYSP